MALMAIFMFLLAAAETVTFEQTSPIIWLPTKEYVDGGIVEYDLAATFINPRNVLQVEYDPFSRRWSLFHSREVSGTKDR